MLDSSARSPQRSARPHAGRSSTNRHAAGHAVRYPLYGPPGHPVGRSRIPLGHDEPDDRLPWRFPAATCLHVCEPGDEAADGLRRSPGRHHDASYKLLFSFREVVRDLIHGFISDPWLQTADFESMEMVSAHHVSDGLRIGINDVVWRVQVPGQEQPVYLLIEFQSRTDTHMAARMLAYVGMFYRDVSRRCQDSGGQGRRRYPLVLPIVFYNGTARWQASTDIAAMIPVVSGRIADHQPRLQYCVIDRATYTESELATQRNLVAVLMRLEQAMSVEAVFGPLRLARQLVQGNAALDHALTAWVVARSAGYSANALGFTEVHNLMELDMQLSEGYGKWARRLERDLKRKVKAEVRAEVQAEVRAKVQAEVRAEVQAEVRAEVQAEVRAEAKAQVLITLLDHRFGPLPEDIVAKVCSASGEQIDDWVRRALYAQRLDGVFLC